MTINKMTDRQAMFEEDIESPYLWCLHCERTYTRGEYRTVKIDHDYLELCPYEDCDGDTIGDAWTWERIRQSNPQYPEIPEKGKFYPMYPKK